MGVLPEVGSLTSRLSASPLISALCFQDIQSPTYTFPIPDKPQLQLGIFGGLLTCDPRNIHSSLAEW